MMDPDYERDKIWIGFVIAGEYDKFKSYIKNHNSSIRLEYTFRYINDVLKAMVLRPKLIPAYGEIVKFLKSIVPEEDVLTTWLLVVQSCCGNLKWKGYAEQLPQLYELNKHLDASSLYYQNLEKEYIVRLLRTYIQNAQGPFVKWARLLENAIQSSIKQRTQRQSQPPPRPPPRSPPPTHNYYYNLLGIQPGASHEQIRSAYKRMVLIHHPDKGGSEEKFKLLNDAYHKLLTR
jgi:hypothetical protein